MSTTVDYYYTREYYLASRHRGHALPGVVRGYSSIKAPISHGQDYADYYDDYYDYDYPGDDLFARIVKAVKKNKKENPVNGLKDPSKILINSVQENFEFPKELLEALPDIDDIEYEDFESLNEQVESFNQIRRKKNIHQS